MSRLKIFRTIPKDIVEWTRWAQDQPDLEDDTKTTGSSSFVGSTPRTITVDEDSADYTVLLETDEEETLWVTSKTKTSFKVNSSNSTSTAVINWVLIR